MGDGQPAQPGAEKTAGLVRQQSQAKQRAQVAHAKQLADDGGGGRHGGQPGQPQAGGKQVVGPGGGRGHQVKRNQQRARAIHHRQHIFAAVARHARPGVQAADNIRQADNGQRPAGHRRRQAAQIHLAGQVGDQKGNMKAAGEKPQVQQQIAAVGHRLADGAQHPALRRAGRGRRLVAARQPAHHRQRQ